MAEEERKDRPATGEPAPEQAPSEAADTEPGPDAAAESPAKGETQPEAEPDLREALEAAEARAEENWNQFLRARAEMENMRRRAARDVEQARQQSLEKLAGELLAVKDSLEMGVDAANEESADVAKLREGSELTLRMFNQALEKFGIEELNPKGERFDPERHEAMAAQESTEYEPNTVVHVVQKGYRLGERLLRPAMVIVAKGGSGSGQSGGNVDEQA
ncbi:nucleotide exchange factor GrpE [Sediminicurvatus halobius]|uniref:Protein GrpE n=1 Tax=Sediminicurvatus halobius TaxID=2182432 RepID=A0A2U2MY11_9GAMM|nr:nucleotide exchange factor GrpE [Spiribacter halobius]PWG61673.1 nucleotide exchange factor GrpE [Spiribacter halobius]UEX79428.1 nucleotide exchange factor GrpE [Spiribacter halobius]